MGTNQTPFGPPTSIILAKVILFGFLSSLAAAFIPGSAEGTLGYIFTALRSVDPAGQAGFVVGVSYCIEDAVAGFAQEARIPAEHARDVCRVLCAIASNDSEGGLTVRFFLCVSGGLVFFAARAHEVFMG